MDEDAVSGNHGSVHGARAGQDGVVVQADGFLRASRLHRSEQYLTVPSQTFSHFLRQAERPFTSHWTAGLALLAGRSDLRRIFMKCGQALITAR
jgi:hypothetical protein